MWMYDFHIFYLGGKAVLSGISPYTIPDFNGPYFLAMAFTPLALLPEYIAYSLYLIINLALLWKISGKRGLIALFCFPVIFTLFVGQIDLTLAMIASLGSPWGLVLLLLKPQVGFVLAPWYLARLDKTGWRKLIVGCGALIGISFLLDPNWISDWFANPMDAASYSIRTSNLLWVIPPHLANLRVVLNLILAVLALPLALSLSRRVDAWSTLSLFQPLSNIYSSTVLVEWITLIEVGLSWLIVFLVGGDIHHGMPMFVIPLSILIRTHWDKLSHYLSRISARQR
jgi:hypothetical protein